MKKEILKLGKALTQAEQKTILGGGLGDVVMGVCYRNNSPGSFPSDPFPNPCNEKCPDGTPTFCFGS